jgi:hypothetical protein
MNFKEVQLFDQLITNIFEKVEDDKIMRIMFGKHFQSAYELKIKGILTTLENSGYTVTNRNDEFPRIMKNGVDYTEIALLKHLNN